MRIAREQPVPERLSAQVYEGLCDALPGRADWRDIDRLDFELTP
jgi:hypothetical protein